LPTAFEAHTHRYRSMKATICWASRMASGASSVRTPLRCFLLSEYMRSRRQRHRSFLSTSPLPVSPTCVRMPMPNLFLSTMLWDSALASRTRASSSARERKWLDDSTLFPLHYEMEEWNWIF